MITTNRFLAAAILALLVFAPPASGQDGAWDGRTVLVTGANRGLGLEFARQLHGAGATVIGTARKPAEADELNALGVRVVQLDVADPASVAAMAAELEGVALDAVLNNAGIFPQRESFEDTDPDTALRVYAVNAVGPLRVSQALLPHLRAGEGKLVMNMSSGLGSIENADRGGMGDYRMSKAALNMLSRTMAADLRNEGFIVVAMSPGWVRTDMGGPNANLSPAESVEGMLRTLAGLSVEDSGGYFNHDGSRIPW
jgi:NAD(P)-dependent dehydrogenase (short-subunit alcohol dehydrogenase family)